MKITALSDCHGYLPELEGGDLLIVAGDLTAKDTEWQHDDFFVWLNDQKYTKKIFIGGNHDNYLERNNEKFLQTICKKDLEYLCDSGTEFQGLKIWGSPCTAWFNGMNPRCMAFTINEDHLTEYELNEKWSLIPSDTDILITHCSPYRIMDKTSRGENVGSRSLKDQVFERVMPLMHVFGHIHEAYGQKEIDGIKFVNASIMDERYRPVNKPINIIL